MEDNLNPEPISTPPADICIQCNSSNVLQGYPNKLCADCRKNLINYPIPNWVKFFGIGILLLTLIATFWLPKNLSAAISLAKAERYEKQGDYLSAQRELEKARQIVPNSDEILANLVVASYHNSDMTMLSDAANKLGTRNMDDTVLVHQVNDVFENVKSITPDSAFTISFAIYKGKIVPDTAYENYLTKHPYDVFAMLTLASQYDNEQKLKDADNLLNRLLHNYRDNATVLLLKSVIKREQNQIDSAIYYVDKELSINRQNLYAISLKARILLKSGKISEGLRLALQCQELDKNNGYNIATLAIAFHLSKEFKKRDEYIALSKKDTGNIVYTKFAEDIIANKTNL